MYMDAFFAAPNSRTAEILIDGRSSVFMYLVSGLNSPRIERSVAAYPGKSNLENLVQIN